MQKTKFAVDLDMVRIKRGSVFKDVERQSRVFLFAGKAARRKRRIAAHHRCDLSIFDDGPIGRKSVCMSAKSRHFGGDLKLEHRFVRFIG